jgi:DNA-binding XRE family transcriptional regulator
MTTWKQHKQELLKNPKFKASYDELEPEYRLANELIRARLGKKMTQAEVAEKAGVSRVVVARLESGTTNPTVETVNRVAGALGKELKLVGSS